MGAFISSYFIPLHQLPDVRQLPSECISDEFPIKEFSLAGFLQLVFLTFCYGYIILTGSNMIAGGSELLLLIPRIAPVVGALVLPVLGAVPDGAIVLFSGMGPREAVQKQLSIGVGALAGSTIILLTVPWMLSVLSGRVDVSPNGAAKYKSRPKSTHAWQMVNKSGVQPDFEAASMAARMMLITTLPYLLIQGSAFVFHSQKTMEERSASEAVYASIGLVTCFVFFVGYLSYHLRGASKDKVLLDRTEMVQEKAVKDGVVSIFGIFSEAMEQSSMGMNTELDLKKRFHAVAKHFFDKFDLNGNGEIDAQELTMLLKELNVSHDQVPVERFLSHFDADGSGQICFEEFFNVLSQQHSNGHHTATTTEHEQQRVLESNTMSNNSGYGTLSSSPMIHGDSDKEGEDEEEEEEMPHDLAHLPVDEQRKQIVYRALRMMGLGLLLVVLFSDALVDTFSELGEISGINPFYISFLLAPLASNASEIIASYSYAQRKTSKTITISLCTLMGAAILNNSFVLGIFLGIVRFRELDWEYSAETIAILCVELGVGYVVLTRKVHTVKDGLMVLSFFPLSLLLVAFLESSYVGLD